jgi:hypothetical protein
MKFSVKKKELLEFSAALIFIIMGIVFRVLPHPWNFTPIAAIALLGGVYFSRRIALLLPLAIMVISDIFIGSYAPKLMISVYGSFILCVVLGFWLKKHKKWNTIATASIFGSFLFFLITNFSVWAFSSWYVKDFSGLIQCYIMALPFLKNTLLGDLFYVTIFFGAYEMARVLIKEKFGLIKGYKLNSK